MLSGSRLMLVALVILLVPAACTRLPGPGGPDGQVAELVELPSADEVPAEWGALVAVTQGPVPQTSLMWFEDESGTIRIVGYNVSGQRLATQAHVVRRR